MASLTFTCNVIHGDKKRKLQRDKNGYFEQSIGAFNVFNSNNEYYPALPTVASMFKSGGIVKRMLDTGNCRGEQGHPQRETGMTKEEYLQRFLLIDPKETACHFKEITLEDVTGADGNKYINIIAKVKPSGPHAAALEATMENPDENACFSIRCFSIPTTVAGRRERHITDIITWDYVNEPGISEATKFNTPTLESIGETGIVTPKEFYDLAHSSDSSGLTAESSSTAKRILTRHGWDDIQVVTPIDLRYLGW